MHKFLRTMTAAAVAAAMAPAFAVDATYNVDVVVVGAGAAGTAAGWAAAEKGLKVVTLEKQAMVGGTGKFSEGIFAVESSMQRFCSTRPLLIWRAFVRSVSLSTNSMPSVIWRFICAGASSTTS